MIYVSNEQYAQVEYLIGQSIQGNHVLFDLAMVRRAFRSSTSTVENAYEVEHHIERLILLKDLAEKKAYLEGLSQETLDLVVRTYFYIIENNIFENSKGTVH